MKIDMKYCSNCGAKVTHDIPEMDDRIRAMCPDCGSIHYENPKMIVGILPYIENKVLLCKRAISPREGFWTLPSGFMELNETLEAGAKREAMEEAHAETGPLSLFCVYSIPHISQVYFIFRGELQNMGFKAGIETSELSLYSEKTLPWDNISFNAIQYTLEQFFKDLNTGIFSCHISHYQA